MMAKKPDDRPASMTEVIALLQASKHLDRRATWATVARAPRTDASAPWSSNRDAAQAGRSRRGRSSTR